jgi:hypothetical protein
MGIIQSAKGLGLARVWRREWSLLLLDSRAAWVSGRSRQGKVKSEEPNAHNRFKEPQ